MTDFDDDGPRTRDQWMECGGGPAELLAAMEAWAEDIYGMQPWSFGDTFHDLLDDLAARGYRVTRIEAPNIADLLPPSAD